MYVRIDHKVEGAQVNRQDFLDHIKYLQGVSKERFFMGGGFKKKAGGMIVFAASDLDEAIKISEADPLISRNLYTYEIVEWEMIIFS
ncbi:YciI family protein [Abyssisolibacter fermentans]|uniref:YciI family protein n=1 Tax=Abyssisolibacter fermentans TaxID=1766203 RepID=UPI001FA7EC09|nr:YciI family protein [Abyssisolibacter fermentans]